MAPNGLAGIAVEGKQLVGRGHRIDPVFAHRRGAAHRRRQIAPPKDFAGLGLQCDHLAEAGGGIDAPRFIGQTAAEETVILFFRWQIHFPEIIAGLGIERAEPGFGIDHKSHAATDDWLRCDFFRIGIAFAHRNGPGALQILTHLQMVHGMVGKAAGLWPGCVWLRRRQLNILALGGGIGA